MERRTRPTVLERERERENKSNDLIVTERITLHSKDTGCIIWYYHTESVLQMKATEKLLLEIRRAPINNSIHTKYESRSWKINLKVVAIDFWWLKRESEHLRLIVEHRPNHSARKLKEFLNSNCLLQRILFTQKGFSFKFMKRAVFQKEKNRPTTFHHGEWMKNNALNFSI